MNAGSAPGEASGARWWYVSSARMTFAVQVRDGIVVDSAPIGRRFIGQPATNLGAWMRKQGAFRCESMRADSPSSALPAGLF